jgi:hypothetical protein
MDTETIEIINRKFKLIFDGIPPSFESPTQRETVNDLKKTNK